MKRILCTVFAASLAIAGANAQTVAKRKATQQERIADGVAKGTLTPAETAKLEKKEASINHEVKADRAANGGKLTAAQKRHINHKQNKASKAIHAQKTDAQVTPQAK